MEIENCVALVTGAARGIGRGLVECLAARGAARIYAGVRGDAAQTVFPGDGRIVPIRLDVTDDGQVAQAAARCGDVTLLVNNAGIQLHAAGIAAEDLAAARVELEVNYFGPLRMCRAFAPILERNGGGAIVNILSLASLFSLPRAGTYSASKAAAHSMTRSIRAELAGQRTFVMAIYPGPYQTDMASTSKMAKFPPSMLADAMFDALRDGTEDVFPDPVARALQARLQTDPKGVERQFATELPRRK